jgi:hypothetical protein
VVCIPPALLVRCEIAGRLSSSRCRPPAMQGLNADSDVRIRVGTTRESRQLRYFASLSAGNRYFRDVDDEGLGGFAETVERLSAPATTCYYTH